MSNGCSENVNNSPIILIAAINSGPGATILTFHADSTVEWISGMFSSPQNGRYKIIDSLINIEGIKLERALKSEHLLLTRKNPINRNLNDLILLQINQNREIIDSNLIFKITVDNRK